jgi:hypothetical protein
LDRGALGREPSGDGNAPVQTAWAQLYVVHRDDGTIGEYDASTGGVINAALVTGLSDPTALKTLPDMDSNHE